MNNHNEVKSHEFSNQGPLLQVLTVDEVANFLRVGTGRLKSAVKKGEIPGVRRIGRHLRFHRDTLLRWLDGETCSVDQEQTATHGPADEKSVDSHANRDAEKPGGSVDNPLDYLAKSVEGTLIDRELAELNRTLRRACGARKRMFAERDWGGFPGLDFYWGHLNRKAREAVTAVARGYTQNDSVRVDYCCQDLESALDFIRYVNAQLAAPIAQKDVAAHG